MHLTAPREALETDVESPRADRSIRTVGPTRTSDDVERVAELLEAADRPVMITTAYDGARDAFVRFAETAGAAVVEHSPIWG